jgi:hypothetical protein
VSTLTRWQELKNEWAAAMDQHKPVTIKINVLYAPDDSQQPAGLDYSTPSMAKPLRARFAVFRRDTMQPANQHEARIDVLFDMVRNYIEQAIDDDWAEAILVAVIEDDASGLTYGRYQRPGAPDQQHCFDTDYRMYFAFDELRQRQRALTGRLWQRAEYTVSRNGESYVELFYPTVTLSDPDVSPVA